MPRVQVAVIGAGLAGLAAAADLRAGGHEVVVWEKSRGAGGRTATRRGPQGTRFDHGAPFLHDGDAPLTGLAAVAGVAAQRPDGSLLHGTVGEPSANAPAKALAAGADLRAGIRVASIVADGARWALAADDGSALGVFDAVLVTAPAPQAAELLREPAPALAARAGTVLFDPCWSVMAAWDEPLGLAFTVASGEPLQWALAEAAKPGRAPGERWVLQGSPDWSSAHLEAEPGAVAPQLLAAFAELAGASLPDPLHVAAHRWRYSRPRTPLPEPFLAAGSLLAAGDWCGGDSAGAALRSGRAAAAALSARA